MQDWLREGKLAPALAELRRLRINYIVWPAGPPLEGRGVEKVYQDESYQVYRLNE